jgi:hypothetical protein
VGNFPIAPLKPVVDGLVPEGDWAILSDYKNELDGIESRLLKLRPSRMGEAKVVISRSLQQLGVAMFTGKQRRLEIPLTNQEGGDDNKQSQTTIWDGAAIRSDSAKAVDVAQRIIGGYESGSLNSAEKYLELLKQSPDRDLTVRTVQGSAAKGFAVACGNHVFDVGGGPRIPGQLETEQTFMLTIDRFSDANATSVRCYVKRINGNASNEIARDVFSVSRPYLLNFEGSPDALLLRYLIIECESIDVEVTASVSISGNVIKELTLCRVTKRNELRRHIERVTEQLRLALAA